MKLQVFQKSFMDKIRTILLMKDSFEMLGILIYSMKIKIVEFKGTSIEAAKAIGGVAYTDGETITIVTGDDDLNLKKILHLLMHEMFHILFKHVQRRGPRDPRLWQIVADHCVERDLNSYVKKNITERPYEVCFNQEWEDKYPKQHAEKLYDIIAKDAKDRYSFETLDMDEGQSDQDGNDIPKQILEVTDNNTGEKSYHALDIPKNINPQQKKKLEKTSKEKIQKAQILWNSSGTKKGSIPGNIVQLLDELLCVELPWDYILENSLMFHSDEAGSRSWVKPNNYIRNFKVPGRYTDTRPRTFVFVIDTSGSMSDDELRKSLSIACQSTHYFDSIQIIMHDMKIQHPILYFDDQPDEDMVFEEVRKFRGRGGTSHREVFEHLDEIMETELISVVAFITDFESDVNRCVGHTKWHKEIPGVWIVTENYEKPDYLGEGDHKWIKINR